MPGVTHHHPQLLTVKERSDNKVPLVKECPRMIPFTHPAQKIPGGQRQLQPGGVQHDQGEGYQKTITFRRIKSK